MRVRPGYEVYWREPGVSQFGLDPRCSVVFDGLSERAQRLLERAPEVHDISMLRERGNLLGMTSAQVREVIDRMERAGLLTEQPVGEEDGPDARYWSQAAGAGQERPADRRTAVVEIRGMDSIGLRVALIAAQAGVGTLLLRDETAVTMCDVSPGLFRPGDVGQPRERAALALLRTAAPQVLVSAPEGRHPDLVVLVQHDVVDPVAVRALMRDDVAHLSVLTGGLAVTVGPMVRPGLGVCTRCLDLYRCAEDERWPAVATQAATRAALRSRGTETSLTWSGAALAAQQLLAAVDGRAVAADGATLELTAWDAVPAVRHWQPHPSCGCTVAALTAYAG
ncbi:ThiF family adenylyltransferase [Ruania halotolerans]|uniref:ThiF family adenylyltransferase n=1 Tax=Ruania halotolerans TaxID=2897773 RepID=UPI001E417F32|nr:ThiF family adenylyltransferase [Ruania halotolerans]UFU05560.1 ThiF family adenylyltransferase [Ruania halotolerans]